MHIDDLNVSVGSSVREMPKSRSEATEDLRTRGWRAVKRIILRDGQPHENREWTGRIDHLATHS